MAEERQTKAAHFMVTRKLRERARERRGTWDNVHPSKSHSQ